MSLGVEAGLDVAAGTRSLCVWALVWDSLCPMMALRLMGALWRTLGQYVVKTVDVN